MNLASKRLLSLLSFMFLSACSAIEANGDRVTTTFNANNPNQLTEVKGVLVINGTEPRLWLGLRDEQNKMWRLMLLSPIAFQSFSAHQNKIVKVIGYQQADYLSNPQIKVEQLSVVE